MCQYMREWLPESPNGIVVDLGFGEVAVTTVEMARILWRNSPDMHIIGSQGPRLARLIKKRQVDRDNSI